jgi:hypothetical protein
VDQWAVSTQISLYQPRAFLDMVFPSSLHSLQCSCRRWSGRGCRTTPGRLTCYTLTLVKVAASKVAKLRNSVTTTVKMMVAKWCSAMRMELENMAEITSSRIRSRICSLSVVIPRTNQTPLIVPRLVHIVKLADFTSIANGYVNNNMIQ